MSLQSGRKIFWTSCRGKKRRGIFLFVSALDTSKCFVEAEHDGRIYSLPKLKLQPTKQGEPDASFE